MRVNMEVSRVRGGWRVVLYALVKPEDGKRTRYTGDTFKIKQDAIDDGNGYAEANKMTVEDTHDAYYL